ncbi:MAG: hypothetical protein IJY36_01060 [Coprobacter sp.]|nr:hypothetical protein [Coprobacter sp.]
MKKSKYFAIKELVCRHIYERYGEKAYMFIDDRLIETLEIIREKILGRPMIINTWAAGGNATQRGVRCNLCSLVRNKSLSGQLYLSAHCMGKAADISVEGLTGEDMRRKIIARQDLLPYPIRMEADVAWLHIDLYDTGGGKISLFNG